ncbi:MAG: EAL domain-containing protein [Pseudomonadota bacterium]
MPRLIASLRAQLLLLVLLGAVPAFLIIFILADHFRHTIHEQMETQLLDRTRQLAEQHQGHIDQTHQLLIALAQIPAIQRGEGEACESVLADILHHGSFPLSNLLSIRPNGDVLCNGAAPGKRLQVGDRDYFQLAMRTGRFAVGHYIISRTNNKPVLGLIYPHLSDGRIDFLTFAALDLSWLNDHPQIATLPEHATLTVIDRQGTVLLRHPHGDAWLGKEMAGHPLVSTLLEQDAGSHFVAEDLEGGQRFFAYAPLGPEHAPHARLALGLPEDVATAHDRQLLMQALASLLLAILLVLGVGWASTGGFLMRRVQPVIAAVRRIMHGDLSVRIGLPPSRDELGELASAVDAMAASLEYQEQQAGEALAALRENKERLDMVLQATEMGLWDWNVQTGEVIFNEGWAKMLGYRLDELEPNVRTWERLVHPDDLPRILQVLNEHLEGYRALYETEHRMRTKDGEWRWILDRGKVMLRDAEGRPLRAAGTHQDITEKKRAEEQLAYLAHHDALTGLPNRVLFAERTEHAIRRAARDHQHLALLFLDLDHFKNINDSLGHALGDRLLQAVARRLREQLRDEDTLARMGGDEFIILLENAGQPHDVAHTAQRLLQAFTPSFEFEGNTLFVSTSIGIALYPQDGEDLSLLMQRADAALYRSKAEGRNAFHFFSAEMAEAAAERLHIESGLRRALEHGELELHYQPQMDLERGEVIGMEALARWHHPERGWIPPARFIPVAEESGLIVRLGQWALREACLQLKRWQAAGLAVGYVAVNVSTVQFRHGTLVEDVRQAIESSGIAAGQLELEITESFILHDPEAATRILKALRDLGVRLAIDDFGTGYSSLLYLKRLPLDRIKIDQGFVRDMLTDPQDEAIVRAVIALGHSLELDVLAEGVETAEHASRLRELGCHAAQGYHFGRPAPASQHD